ncbi:MAG TPA: hypothetical protein VMC06_06700 [Opitutaceae bacterium]|nr:hypothetical protein [Opitutaceae bacterium]
MNFEELENLWAGQQPANARPIDLDECRRALLPELKRRSRFLGYAAFSAGFALLVYPLLSVVNFLHARPHNVPLYGVNLTLHVVVMLALLIYVVRLIRRHRALVRQNAGSIRSIAELSLANIEAEIRDYRAAWWLLPLFLALPLLSVQANLPVAEFGWGPLLRRAGLVVGFLAVVGLVFWRHYRANLKPARARQKEILRQLG